MGLADDLVEVVNDSLVIKGNVDGVRGRGGMKEARKFGPGRGGKWHTNGIV